MPSVRPAALLTTALLSAALMGACGTSATPDRPDQPMTDPGDDPDAGEAAIEPANWPELTYPLARDTEMEARIADLLSRMTLEEKVGQVIQVDIAAITPAEAREYEIGSVLNGGNSAPGGDVRVEPQAWLDLADAFWNASTDTSDGGVGIPILWGTDAVHGHNNIVGATIFPHNIGLGAANDPALLREIGEVTAAEMLATGLDWTFAPTLAVARDDRWGRTYESYSEDPALVASYADEVIEGLQGEAGTDGFLARGRMIATAKHFVGDGGTTGGVDQGNTDVPESVLRDVHAAGYVPAIEAGVQVVMASFSSYKGEKLHGYEALLDDVLVERMGFDGFVVGDWNGHGQVEGCRTSSCPQAFDAGVDMFMAPTDWKDLYRNTLAQVRSGEISEARLDEAVARILRVKMRAGLFEAGRPSGRPDAGDWSVLSDPAHKALARRAVRRSLVLLKNEGVLPLAPDATVLVAGDGADDIGKLAGGWTYSWQGDGNDDADFPYGQSVYDALAEALSEAGGRAVLSEDGRTDELVDAAIVVFGEDPYAEFQGDVRDVDFAPTGPLRILRRLRERGVPTVSVFLSGRPMWVNPEINASDAFVAAWLPGDQAGGIADVLVAGPGGEPRHDFTGRLSFTWPSQAGGRPPNRGEEAGVLFPYGYGLGYGEDGTLAALSEDPGDGAGGGLGGDLMTAGGAGRGWRLVLADRTGEVPVAGSLTRSPAGTITAESRDVEAQEDSRVVTWTGPGSVRIEAVDDALDLRAQANGGVALAMSYRVLSAPEGPVTLSLNCRSDCGERVALGDDLRAATGRGWRTAQVPLRCFGGGQGLSEVTAPFVVEAEGGLALQIHTVSLAAAAPEATCGLGDAP